MANVSSEMNEHAKLTLTLFMLLEKLMKETGKSPEITGRELEDAINVLRHRGFGAHGVEIITAKDVFGQVERIRARLANQVSTTARNRVITLE